MLPFRLWLDTELCTIDEPYISSLHVIYQEEAVKVTSKGALAISIHGANLEVVKSPWFREYIRLHRHLNGTVLSLANEEGRNEITTRFCD